MTLFAGLVVLTLARYEPMRRLFGMLFHLMTAEKASISDDSARRRSFRRVSIEATDLSLSESATQQITNASSYTRLDIPVLMSDGTQVVLRVNKSNMLIVPN
jgi:hypothetical protein